MSGRNRPRRPAPIGFAVPRLVDAAPLVGAVARIATLQSDRRALTPSDPVVEALGSIVEILTDALEEASTLETWLDVTTAAQILGCTPAHVANLCRQAKLEAIKVGGEWRVARHAVEGPTRER